MEEQTVPLYVFLIAAFLAFMILRSRAKRLFRSVIPNLKVRSDQNTAKVLYVLDGDTVDVERSGRKERIRLDAIDCPEEGQPWGETAKAGLIKLVGGQTVRLDTYGQDKYGRTLATIYVQNYKTSGWTNVNERMVMLGHAWVMRAYYKHLPRNRQNSLNRIEAWAKSKKVGLWSALDPIPPWEWRKER